MKAEITIEEAEKLVGVSASKEWNGRRYFNVPGAAYKLYHQTGKLHFALGKGRSTDAAYAVAINVLGCNPVDRYSKAAAYVVVEG